ncbi:hypothetical protein [Portibacter lacus]|uniref:Uncharacterized protein n=1 Tax=Portibacter lacus TaxID=1099794 RepID=A0AA37WBZ4_9BACT|nr:hypothetical protein [Portibacter lacus]GLR15583.1 hypothetical protein GCM10007940_01980 [Portibacter lacus]
MIRNSLFSKALKAGIRTDESIKLADAELPSKIEKNRRSRNEDTCKAIKNPQRQIEN